MLQVGAFEAKNTLGSLLDKVEQGEQVLITRHGKPVARLVRPSMDAADAEAARVADVRAAFASIHKIAEERRAGRSAQPFDFEDFKRARDEGRP